MNRLDLKRWRRTRYLTQSQLGELLGVDKQTVFRWESGASEPAPYLYLALERLDGMHYFSPDGIDALPRLAPVAH